MNHLQILNIIIQRNENRTLYKKGRLFKLWMKDVKFSRRNNVASVSEIMIAEEDINPTIIRSWPRRPANHKKVTNSNQIYYIRLFLVSWANFGPANRRSKVLRQRSSSYPGVRGNRNLLLTPTTWSPLATYRNRKSTSGILTCWYQNKMYKIKFHNMVKNILARATLSPRYPTSSWYFNFHFVLGKNCAWLLTHSK